jgi:hypothetical protein
MSENQLDASPTNTPSAGTEQTTGILCVIKA